MSGEHYVRGLPNALPSHEVHSATDSQGRGVSNGELLRLAEQQALDPFVVADKNMRYRQDLSGRRITVLELWTNHRPTLERHFQYICASVERMIPGQYLELTAPATFPRK